MAEPKASVFDQLWKASTKAPNCTWQLEKIYGQLRTFLSRLSPWQERRFCRKVTDYVYDLIGQGAPLSSLLLLVPERIQELMQEFMPTIQQRPSARTVHSGRRPSSRRRTKKSV